MILLELWYTLRSPCFCCSLCLHLYCGKEGRKYCWGEGSGKFEAIQAACGETGDRIALPWLFDSSLWSLGWTQDNHFTLPGPGECKEGEWVLEQVRAVGSLLLFAFPVSPSYLNLFMASDVFRASNQPNAFTSLFYEPHITGTVIQQKLWHDHKESCADVTWRFLS